MHCVACSCPAGVIVGRHTGSRAAQWLPWEPSNIPRRIPEMAIKRNFTLLFFKVNLFAFANRLFHKDFSPIYEALFTQPFPIFIYINSAGFLDG